MPLTWEATAAIVSAAVAVASFILLVASRRLDARKVAALEQAVGLLTEVARGYKEEVAVLREEVAGLRASRVNTASVQQQKVALEQQKLASKEADVKWQRAMDIWDLIRG